MKKLLSFCRLVRRLLAILGFLSLLLLALQFTAFPWRAILALSRSPHAPADLPSPDAPSPASAILLFSGSGVPGESALVRIHYAAALAARHPSVPLWAAVPDTPETAPQVRAYLDELALRGVAPSRVRILGRGDSTATQAAEAAALLPPDSAQPPLLIVTTPYHIRRAAAALHHANPRLPLVAVPAWSKSVDDSPALFTAPSSPDTPAQTDIPPAPGTSDPPSALYRYTLWTNLRYTLEALRETAALLFYALRNQI